jgi:protein tyrosine phosphatase (PTP) superfamily phosphohydrolase (DUF442 family)
MKKILILLVVVLAGVGAYDYWHKHMDYNFGVITEGRVFKSGAIKPDEIESYTSKYHIKTVIDLRNEVSKQYPSELEADAIAKINGVNYVNIRSRQVPDKNQLKTFFEILDNEDNYPVLIHCYHGLGRTMLYTALYRIEYEGASNEEARSKTRFIVESFFHDSSFATGTDKGNFLINYKPRSMGEEATINHLEVKDF